VMAHCVLFEGCPVREMVLVLCAVCCDAGWSLFSLPWNCPCLTVPTCTSMFTGYCVVRLFCGTAAYHLLGSLLILCVISLFARSTLDPPFDENLPFI